MPERTEAHFVGRTFHHRDFTVEALVERKRALGTTISVVIPALTAASE